MLNFTHSVAHGTKAQACKKEDIRDESVDPALVKTFLTKLYSIFLSVFKELEFPTKKIKLYEHRINFIDKYTLPPHKEIL